MRCVLVGYGEIGKGVKEVFGEMDVNDPFCDLQAEGEYDILLVALPYTNTFEAQVRYYQRQYKPKATIIFSTVPIGTSRRLGASHCPIEGKHPYLAESIRITDKWLGNPSPEALGFFADFNVIAVEPEVTEFLKLRSTTLYGVNIEFARYSKQVCDELEIDYSLVQLWDSWYNLLYDDLGMPEYRRYLLDAPEGKIGGHCVVPNARLLNEQFPDPLIERVANA